MHFKKYEFLREKIDLLLNWFLIIYVFIILKIYILFLTFVYWSHVVTELSSFIWILCSFLLGLTVFSKWDFFCTFSILTYFSFSYFLVLSGILSSMLMCVVIVGIFLLFLSLKRMIFLFTNDYDVSCEVIILFCQLGKFPSVPSLLRVSNRNECCVSFICKNWNDFMRFLAFFS